MHLVSLVLLIVNPYIQITGLNNFHKCVNFFCLSSSPGRSPGIDTETMMMNNVYRDRFPNVSIPQALFKIRNKFSWQINSDNTTFKFCMFYLWLETNFRNITFVCEVISMKILS